MNILHRNLGSYLRATPAQKSCCGLFARRRSEYRQVQLHADVEKNSDL